MRIEIHLSCGHVRYWRDAAPKMHESVYCFDCDNTRQVVGKTGTWEARCERCTFLQRRAGYERILTQIERHLRSCPRHVVRLSRIGSERVWHVKRDTPDTVDTGDPNLMTPQPLW